jgi:hypothetical protein
MRAFQQNAFQNNAFQMGETPTPPIDTHDGVGWVEPSLKKKHIDPFDRRGILRAIELAAGLISEEEPENAGQAEAIATQIRAEIERPEVDPLLLAAEIEQLAALSRGIEGIYAELYRITENLYNDQDEEDAILVLLM